MDFDEIIENVGRAVDALGVAVMVLGLALVLVLYLRRLVTKTESFASSYRRARVNAGRSILLGLELLVAGDIIRSVAVSPTFRSVGVLAVIVLIRSFLSFTLEMEISGRWPWQRRAEGPEVDTPGSA